MYQIDDTSAASTVPAPPTDNIGTPGYFQGSNGGAQAATRIRFWWLNCVQGALVSLLASAGIAQSKTDFTVVPQAVSIIGARRQVFTTSGTFTVPAGVYRLRIRLWGGGGPGGNGNSGAGGGGAAGGYYDDFIAVTPGQAYPVTIGAAGVAGMSAGGATSFGSVASATGGGGGGLGPNGPGSVAFGNGAGPGRCSEGQSGQNGLSTSGQNTGGQGGGVIEFFGGAAQPVGPGGNATGNNGQVACGGSGGVGSGVGGSGGPGCAIVEY